MSEELLAIWQRVWRGGTRITLGVLQIRKGPSHTTEKTAWDGPVD